MKLDWRQLALGAAIGVILAAVSFRVAARRHFDPSRRMDRLAHKLDLTPDQRKQLDALMAEGRQKMKAMHKEGQAKIRAILTPEQQEKFDRMKKRKMIRRMAR